MSDVSWGEVRSDVGRYWIWRCELGGNGNNIGVGSRCIVGENADVPIGALWTCQPGYVDGRAFLARLPEK